jgi:hypothetical protein
MFIVTSAVLSEHLLRGNVAVVFWIALKVTTPAAIFPDDVLIDMIKSTYDHMSFTKTSL